MTRTLFLLLLLFPSVLWTQSRYTFIENKGQWEENFLFRADIPAGAMFLEDHGITYHLVDWHEWREMHVHGTEVDHVPVFKGHVIKASFVHSNVPSSVISQEPQQYYHNYYRGN